MRLNDLPSVPARPEKLVQRSNEALSTAAMKTNGMRCSTIQNGCVHDWKRLMKVIPWVTSGMTINDDST